MNIISLKGRKTIPVRRILKNPSMGLFGQSKVGQIMNRIFNVIVGTPIIITMIGVSIMALIIDMIISSVIHALEIINIFLVYIQGYVKELMDVLKEI